MSGMVSKSQIPVMRSSELPVDLQTAIITLGLLASVIDCY